jgi:ribosomal 50S subunit-recycling heat shock protein
MRLDLFLKNTHLLRQRSRAKALAEGGGVLVNGRPAKPARDVGPGDVLTFLGDEEQPAFRVEILREAPKPVPRQKTSECYRVLDRERP